MIQNDLQAQLRLLFKSALPPVVEGVAPTAAVPPWTPGERLPAQVLAALPNGRFQVNVDGQLLDLNLPADSRPGGALQLTYVSATPRLTFALEPAAAQAPVASPSVSLSDAARLVSDLLRNMPSAVASQQTEQAQPLLASAPHSIPQLAQALRHALSASGLFYESHQAQWLNGERSLQSLLAEPQGQLSPRLQDDVASRQPMPSAQGTAAPTAGEPAGKSSALDAPPPLVAPQSLPQVQQQLATLESRQLLWQGQVWPGQSMRWEITEEAADDAPAPAEPTRAWRTHLNLALPSLGGVSARLALQGHQVRVEIMTADAEAAVRLRAGQGRLAARLVGSGLQPCGISVRHG